MDLVRKIIMSLSSSIKAHDDNSVNSTETMLPGYESLSDELLEAMQTNLIFMAPNGEIIRLNWKATQELQLSKDVVGQKLTDILILSKDSEDLLPYLMQRLANGEHSVDIPANTLIVKNNSTVRFLTEGRFTGLHDKGGLIQIVFSFRNVVQELTNESMIQLALNTTKIFPWFYDMELGTMIIDPRYFEYTGIVSKDNTMTLEQFAEVLHPEDRELMAHAFSEQLQGHYFPDAVPFRLLRGDGTYEWFEGQSTYLGRIDGQPYRIVGICMSIQSHKDTEQSLIEARDKAERSDKLKSAFLANMSHEIRTPLNAIVGFSTQLPEAESKEEMQMYVNIIETNNELLLQLINDILDLSKIESGMLEFNYSEVNIDNIIKDIWKSARMRQNDRIQIEIDGHLPECTIRTEKTRLTQVLFNFVNNAMKFTHKGSIRLGYELQGNEGIRFYVSDTGIGIPKEMQDKIFERFVKLDSMTQGTGLGLTICAMIVEKLGGKIGVDSETGKGSTFWFTLPCKVHHIQPPVINKKTAESSAISPIFFRSTAPEDSKTILIAEDNESNYLLLHCILKNKYHLKRANNGKEAVELSRQIHPNLILMDIKMPVMDGLEATHIIRQENQEVPIVALTAYAYADDRQKAEDEGCNAFLTKPINRKQLWEVLQDLGV